MVAAIARSDSPFDDVAALRTTLRKALRSRFYAERLAGVLDDEQAARATFDALARVPCTTKEDLREAGLDILAVPVQSTLRYYESSGTTGVPTPTPKTAADIASNTELLLLNWRTILAPRRDVVLLLVPSDIAPVADAMVYALEALEVLSVRAFPFTRGVCGWDAILRVQSWTRANAVLTTPGLLLFLYREVKSRGLDPREIGIRKIFLLGELVTEPMRRQMERMWGADVYVSSYGSSELGTCATSCREKALHLLTEAYHFELRDPATGAFVDGDHGELVVTTLRADARPLLRYATGDLITIDRGGCRCGLDRPIARIGGRIGQSVTVRGVELTPYTVEEAAFSIDGVIGYFLRIAKDGACALCLEVEDRDPGARSRVLDHARAVLAERALPLVPEIADEMNELAKRSGGFKNWKVTHIVRE